MRFRVNTSCSEHMETLWVTILKPTEPRRTPDMMSPAPRKATLIDVARVAGVAPITVSRVMNQPEQVKQKTLLKVRKAIEEIGYVPNLVAGALATSRSRLVAVFLPILTNPIFSDMFQVITDRLSSAGYQVLLGVSGYSAEAEQKQIQAILSRRPDGVILTGTVAHRSQPEASWRCPYFSRRDMGHDARSHRYAGRFLP